MPVPDITVVDTYAGFGASALLTSAEIVRNPDDSLVICSPLLAAGHSLRIDQHLFGLQIMLNDVLLCILEIQHDTYHSWRICDILSAVNKSAATGIVRQPGRMFAAFPDASQTGVVAILGFGTCPSAAIDQACYELSEEDASKMRVSLLTAPMESKLAGIVAQHGSPDRFWLDCRGILCLPSADAEKFD